MSVYADTSFLISVYSPEEHSTRALKWLQRLAEPLLFTPFHRHELRNGIRLRIFRKDITPEQAASALREVESDLEDGILLHTVIPWTAAFRKADEVGSVRTQRMGVRSSDLLHIGVALALDATDFWTFDARQGEVAQAAGLHVRG
jgi:predicted nucleic acid-binding protein